MGDRRTERRQATIDEILAAAWQLVRVEGLAGLSLRELARTVGMRPQSLYSYFPSKHAIYDAMFAQGARQFADGYARLDRTGEPSADLRAVGRYFLAFSTADAARFQLLFQRTIPGFEPSEASYAISIESLQLIADHLVALGIDDPRDLDLFTALGTGLASQQLSNDPGGDRWVRLVDDAVAMYLHHVTTRAGSSGRAER